ncbi:hypothetical protein QBC45DRAFT_338537, partial [Copromyces sp. CBS 386.78]
EDKYVKYYDFNYIEYLYNYLRNLIPFANDFYTPRLITLISIQTPFPSITLA